MTRSTFVQRPFWAIVLAFVLGVIAVVAPTDTIGVVGALPADDSVVDPGALTGSASAFRPINPIRVLDTRTDPDVKRLYDGSAISIDPISGTGVAAAAGVSPSEVAAVVINLTMVNAGGGGFSTVWPTGGKRFDTSTNNTEFTGHTIPNLVIAPLGLDKKISIYSWTSAHIIVDVLGVFMVTGATESGRFVPLTPARAYDSRLGRPEIARNGTLEIDLKNVGVPADATGVVLNLTAVRSRGPGYYRVWSADSPEPEHSTVNVLGYNYIAGNQVITGVSDGKIQVFSDVGGGLTVDVTGYFTGPSAPTSTDGLFVPFTPGRLLDTRQVSGPTAGTAGRPIAANEPYSMHVAGRLGIPAGDASTLALNITAVRPVAGGFLKAYPAGTAEPNTSSLNFTNPGQVVANHAVTSVDTSTGRIIIQPSEQTHVVVDASGYFLAPGAPVPAGGSAVTKTVSPGAFVPAALPAASPTDGPYDFLFDRGTYYARGGVRPTPTIKAAWQNCTPIRYALNVDLAENDQQIQQLIDSIEEMEAATGIDFQFGGVTSAGMNIADRLILPEANGLPYRYLPTDDGGGSVDLVIGFSDSGDTPELGGGVIGIGGSLRTQVENSGRAEQVRGFAVIDLSDLDDTGPASPQTLRNIKITTTHELGHMMGLGHVDLNPGGGGLVPGFTNSVIRDQMMYPALTNSSELNLDDGDLRGLFELYGNRPCSSFGPFGGAGDDRDDDIDWNEVTIIKSHDDF